MSEKQQSQEVHARLRETSDRIGLPQYVVMARALELFDEEIKEVLAEHARKFAPDNVEPRPDAKANGAPAVRGKRKKTGSKKRAKKTGLGLKANGEPRLRRASKRERCEFCNKLFAPQGLASHLGPKSTGDCGLKFRKSKRTK